MDNSSKNRWELRLLLLSALVEINSFLFSLDFLAERIQLPSSISNIY